MKYSIILLVLVVFVLSEVAEVAAKGACPVGQKYTGSCYKRNCPKGSYCRRLACCQRKAPPKPKPAPVPVTTCPDGFEKIDECCQCKETLCCRLKK